MPTDFSAAPQALGYIYQLRFALYKLLSEGESASICVEKLDDIALEKDGNPYEVLQLKRLNKSTVFTDKSPELWKTIRVWSNLAKTSKVKLSETRFFLVSTSQAPQGGIAALLKMEGRNETLALQKLIIEAHEILQTPLKDKVLHKCCNDFLSLTDTHQHLLVKNIFILDSGLDIFDIPSEIQNKFFTAIRREHRKQVYERLEGWWMNKMIEQLGKISEDYSIQRYEVEDKLADLAEQFQPGALPIDYFDQSPDIPDNAENRLFVIQLREIEISSERIEKAISDYYKAVEQRSRWAREDLLFGDELSKFDSRLVDEWQRFSAALVEEIREESEEKNLKSCGRKILNHMEFNTEHLRIREKVSEPYVKRGSYHMLADNLTGYPKVWWHPLFMDRLEELLGTSEKGTK